MTFSRLSVIFLLYRLFFAYKRFVIALWTIGILSIIWFIVSACLWMFRCHPIQIAWSSIYRSTDGSCLDGPELWTGTETFNAVLDVALVILPFMVIRKMSLVTREKVGLFIVFMSGGL